MGHDGDRTTVTTDEHRRVRPSLRDGRFLALSIGEAVNSIGSWASAIALWGFAAYRFDASPGQVSLLIICWSVPLAALSPLLGVLVDRMGARRSLVVAYLGGAGSALGLAAAGSLPAVDVLAVAAGCARALAAPAAGALPPQIVEPDDLLAANSLLGAAGQFGQILGPLVASAALALSGFRAAFLVDAATFVVGVGVLLPLPARHATPEARVSWRHELAEGFRIVWAEQRLRAVIAAGAAVSFTSGAFLVVEPLYARHVLHRPPSQFALFEAAAGFGAILAGFVMPRFERLLERRYGLGLAAVAYGLAACLFVGTVHLAAAYTGAFLWGVAGMVFGVLAWTAIQHAAAETTHGRVFALDSAAQSIAETAGLAVAGVALAGLGVQLGAVALTTVAMGGGVLLLVTA